MGRPGDAGPRFAESFRASKSGLAGELRGRLADSGDAATIEARRLHP
jgi:hypothetical protein